MNFSLFQKIDFGTLALAKIICILLSLVVMALLKMHLVVIVCTQLDSTNLNIMSLNVQNRYIHLFHP